MGKSLACPFSNCRHTFQRRPDLARHCSTRHAGEPIPSPGSVTTAQQRLFWDGVAIRAALAREREEEEEEEEDAPNAPAYTVERHPTAAWPCAHDGTFLPDRRAPPIPPAVAAPDPSNRFSPFDSMRQVRWASWLVEVGLSESQTKRLMDLLEDEEEGAPFRSKRELNEKLASIEEGSEWTNWIKSTITVSATDMGLEGKSEGMEYLDEPIIFHRRNSRAALFHLLGKPEFAGQQQLVPLRAESPTSGKWIGEPMTAEEAWKVQDELPDGWVGVRIDSAQDSTLCSTATGGASEHPIYLSTPILPGHLRRGDYGASVLLAMLPKFRRTGKGKEEVYRRFTRIVRHKAMKIIYEDLRKFITEGELVRFADGHYYHARGYFGPNAVDYPEAMWLNCMVDGWCPVCDCHRDKLLSGLGNPRSTAEAEVVRAEAYAILRGPNGSMKKAVDHAKAFGLHLESPWYAAFGVNGHPLAAPDLLHQLFKGTVKDLAVDRILFPYLEMCAGVVGRGIFASPPPRLSSQVAAQRVLFQ